MCFSASASFAASGGLLVTGLAIQRYKSVSSNEQLFAAIPFMFAAHQFSEGLVWLGVSGTVAEPIQWAAIHFFSFIAFALWPVYVPLAMYRYEKSRLRRFILPLQFIGIIVGLYLLWCYTFFHNWN